MFKKIVDKTFDVIRFIGLGLLAFCLAITLGAILLILFKVGMFLLLLTTMASFFCCGPFLIIFIIIGIIVVIAKLIS